MHILITGGTGFIGRHLTDSLIADGHAVYILSRSIRESKKPAITYIQWDGNRIPSSDQPYDVIINLAGTSIAGPRWSGARKKSIMDSRIRATQACVSYINMAEKAPSVFLSASAVGYYGVEQTQLLTETAAAGNDFAARVCHGWESASEGAQCRTINLRIGIVLGKDGGALQQMLPIYKTYLGGRFGSGKQGFPWIHIADIVGIIRHCMADSSISGPVNLAAPEIVDQATFSARLAKSLGRVDPFVVPEFVLKIALGEQAILFTGGQKVSSEKIRNSGYTFQYPDLDVALANLI